jgi:predicted alpha/beta-fold hydrolase
MAVLAEVGVTTDFRPSFPWWGGDLQTLCTRLLPFPVNLDAWPAEPLLFPLDDGSGDKLLGSLHRNGAAASRPLVILIHGMTGCEDSRYIRASARYFLGRGHPVLRLNLRAAGPSRPLSKRYYNAGSSADVTTVLETLGRREAALLAGGCFAMGYSLGGNILLNCLAETAGASSLRAAVAVSVPLDLKATQVRMMMPRNRVYQHYLLRGLCTSNLAGPVVTPAQRETISRRVHSLYDYDDLVVAPANGFEGAENYYASCSSGRRLGEIKTETLVIHAADDPWIPLAAYQAIDWPALPSQLRLSLTKTGGHVGFHEAGEAIPWHDRASAAFFDAR